MPQLKKIIAKIIFITPLGTFPHNNILQYTPFSVHSAAGINLGLSVLPCLWQLQTDSLVIRKLPRTLGTEVVTMVIGCSKGGASEIKGILIGRLYQLVTLSYSIF